MVAVLKKGDSPKKMDTILQRLLRDKKTKGVNTYKYLGKLSLKKDALEIQKEMRREWE